jgi:hypothetical protein
VLRELLGERRVAVLEQIGRERHLARLSLVDQIHAHRLLREPMRVEQLHAKRRRRVVPQRLVGPEADLLDGIEIDAVQQIGVRNRRRHVGLCRQAPRRIAQHVETEGTGRPQLGARQHGLRKRAREGQKAAGAEVFQQVATRAAQPHTASTPVGNGPRGGVDVPRRENGAGRQILRWPARLHIPAPRPADSAGPQSGPVVRLSRPKTS